MKDPSISRHKRTKLKLLVSFNGAFSRRPPSRKPRYIGGETRIISVERSLSFLKLKLKIAEIIRPSPVFLQFSLRYRISESSCGEDGEEERLLPGLLESDDDVRCMIEEYENMELKGKLYTRLWILVCDINDRSSDNESDFVDKHVLNVNGDEIFGKNNGFSKAVGEGLSNDNKIARENLQVYCGKNEARVKKVSDDCLRKTVLKQQLLAKKLNGFRSLRGCLEQSDIELVSQNEIHDPLIMELCLNHGSHSSRLRNMKFGADLYGEPKSNSRPLNIKDENLRVGSDGSKDVFSRMLGSRKNCYMGNSNKFVPAGKPSNPSCNSGIDCLANGLVADRELVRVDLAMLSNMNRENILPQCGDCSLVSIGFVPPSCCSELISGVRLNKTLQSSDQQCGKHQGGIRYHRFGPSDTRNQRICPYHIRYRSIINEMGNHRNFRSERRPWVEKFRSSSQIPEQGPPSRFQNAASRKPLSGYYKIQGTEGTVDHSHMFLPYYFEENLINPDCPRVPEHEKEKPDEVHATYDLFGGTNDESPLPIDPAGNSLPGAQVDLLTGHSCQKLDIVIEAPRLGALDALSMEGPTPLNHVEELHLRNYQEVVDLSNYPGYPRNSSATELSWENNCSDVEACCHTSGMCQGSAQNLRSSRTSAVDLSLHNLSLESSEKLPVPSCAMRDISDVMLNPQPKDLDLVDEGLLNSGPKVEKSMLISSDSSYNCLAKMGDDNTKIEEVQQDLPESNLIIVEENKNKSPSRCLNVNGGIHADIAAFYTHLDIKEMQAIKNSDLEYLKELGSGTYGTVYFGKWKGSDVAIKRIKPSCFTNGAKEEDRLVADFWKEAHILGRLHHPNVIALYGVVTDGPANNLATVTEYMVNGSLKQVLRRKDRTIDRRKRLIIAMDAAFGMEYLHKKNIVHFDLKSHNFLVNMRDPRRPVCKIGDLGLSKIKQSTLVSGGVRGTIPWMAPELLNGKNLVSEKVDVFSFGIVMWELLTGEEPYADMRSEAIISGIIKGNLRPEIPNWCDPAWRSLMERCWSSDPDSRPSFSGIAKELRSMAAVMNIK